MQLPMEYYGHYIPLADNIQAYNANNAAVPIKENKRICAQVKL